MMRLVSAGLVALTVAASAALADPAPQYSAQDLERSLARPAAADAPPPAAPAAGECEKRGMVTGEDGVCQPVKNERGFSLPTRASMAAGAPKTPPAAFSLPSRANSAGGGARPAPVGPAPHRDLLITFKSGSFDLTPQAQANASVFAQALSSPVLAGGKFEIAGYTDSVGSADLNLGLSQQRAEAVKNFLVSKGVEQSRIVAKGYGASDFADPAHPTAAGNRRVEARRID